MRGDGGTSSLGTALRAANEVLRFLLEIAAVVAFGFAAAQLVDGPVRFGLAVVAMVAAAAYWGILAAPNSSRRLKDPARLVAEIVFFGAAGAALAAAGPVALGIILGLLAIANAVSLRWQEPVLGAIGP